MVTVSRCLHAEAFNSCCNAWHKWHVRHVWGKAETFIGWLPIRVSAGSILDECRETFFFGVIACDRTAEP